MAKHAAKTKPKSPTRVPPEHIVTTTGRAPRGGRSTIRDHILRVATELGRTTVANLAKVAARGMPSKMDALVVTRYFVGRLADDGVMRIVPDPRGAGGVTIPVQIGKQLFGLVAPRGTNPRTLHRKAIAVVVDRRRRGR